MQTRVMAGILMLVLWPGMSHAVDLDDINIHGFGSAGYMRSDQNNYLVASENGSFEFNEVGLSVTTALSDHARAGIQLFSRDLGDVGNNNVVVDWAFLDYQWKEELGLRLGKMKLPENLYNDIRDYDMLRTSILLPQSVYNEYYRDTSASYEGLGVYGNLSLGAGGRLGYDAYAGTAGIDTEGGFAKILSTPDVAFISGTIEYLLGGRIKWHTPVQGLTLGGSLLYLDMEYNSESTTAPVPITGDIPEMQRFFGFMEYTHSNWTVAAEYFGWQYDWTASMDMSALDQPDPPPDEGTWDSEGYYGLLAYRLTDWFEIGAYYAIYYPDRHDRDGEKQVEAGNPDYAAWQKDFAISTRFDLTEYWTVKVEAHTMDGVALCPVLDNQEGFEQDWMLFAVKTTFYF